VRSEKRTENREQRTENREQRKKNNEQLKREWGEGEGCARV
jgi:hypothetical protein